MMTTRSRDLRRGKRTRRLAAVLVAAGLSAGLLAGAPPALAVPGDPMEHCVTMLGTAACDGPIRPDGTWKRCSTNPAFCNRVTCFGPMTHCEIMVPGQPSLLWWAGAEHID